MFNDKEARRISNKTLIAIFAVLLLICSALMYALQKSDASVAEIYLDSVLIEQIDLSAVTAPYTIQVGNSNVVLVEPGRISMQSASCPDQLCVRQGCAGVCPVVCLPGRVIIRLVSSQLDAVIG